MGYAGVVFLVDSRIYVAWGRVDPMVAEGVRTEFASLGNKTQLREREYENRIFLKFFILYLDFC